MTISKNEKNLNDCKVLEIIEEGDDDEYEEEYDDSSREDDLQVDASELEEEDNFVATAVGCGENGKVAMEHIVWKQIYSQRESKKKELPWEKQRLVLDGTRVCCFGVEKPETFGGDASCPKTGQPKDQSTLLANAVARLRQSSLNNKQHMTQREQMKKKKTFMDLQCDRVIVKGTVAGELLPQSSTNSNNYTTRIHNFLAKSNTTNEASGGGSGVNRSKTKIKKGFSPTPFELYLHSKKWNLKWRICFENERILKEWMAALKCIKLQREEDQKVIAENHGFEPGDHIIRWELLPIAWPIQIHGIVLEAGKNCIIIADFGLTSYSRNNQNMKKDSTTTTDEEEEKNKHISVEEQNFQDTIIKSFQSMRPKGKKRLNVITITDPSEIKKWSKVGYGKKSVLKSGHSIKVPKWLSQQMSKLNPMALTTNNTTNNNNNNNKATKEDEHSKHKISHTTKPAVEPSINPNGRWSKHIVEEDSNDEEENNASSKQGRWSSKVETVKKRPTIRTKKLNSTNDNYDDNDNKTSEDTTTNTNEEENNQTQKVVRSPKKGRWKNKEMTLGQAPVHGEEKDEATNDLPDSDPAKIVLARTHFLLEYGEEFLPPYHILYSNSECIAVWCKTGQWSTLQASIFLTSSCIGNAKSATVLTMGAAAAHVVLLPAVAVGGLVWVTTPFVFLKKSKEMWDKATHKMNDLFWSYATPDIFVCAIEFYNKSKNDALSSSSSSHSLASKKE